MDHLIAAALRKARAAVDKAMTPPKATSSPATPLPLPGLPPDLATEQAIQWELVPHHLVTPLHVFLDMIMEVRASYAECVGWLPAQVGYALIKVPSRVRPRCKSYIHVLLADRDLETEVPVEGLNLRVFCYVDSTTGDIYKVSLGKVLKDPRGNILDPVSAQRALTPFGIGSR
jgi:hypothetical protein